MTTDPALHAALEVAVNFKSDVPVFFHVSVPPPEIPNALIPTVVPEARVLIREAAPPTVSPTLILLWC